MEYLLNYLARGRACVYVVPKYKLKDVTFENPKTLCAVCTVNENETDGHWVIFYIKREAFNYIVEYFDSFGEKYTRYGIKFPLPVQKSQQNPLQHENSSLCGNYCLNFAYYKLSGYSFEEVVNSFSRNRIKNDEKIKKITSVLLRNIPKQQPIRHKKSVYKSMCMCSVLKHGSKNYHN